MTFNKKLQLIEKRDISVRNPTGLKLPIYVPQLTTLAVQNYDFETTAALRPLRNFPTANQMSILNTSSYAVKVRLNNSDSSSYVIPASSLITLTSVDYQFFDVQNIGSGTINANEVLIHVIYEDPEKVQVIAGGM